MKRDRSGFAISFALFAFLWGASIGSAFGQEDGKYLLRHVFLPALSATNEVNISMSGTMKLEEGAPMPYDATIEIRMPVKVEELKDDKSGMLAIRVAEFNTTQKVGSESQSMSVKPGYMTVDGDVIWDRRETPGPHPLEELFGSRVEVVISPRGEVRTSPLWRIYRR